MYQHYSKFKFFTYTTESITSAPFLDLLSIV